MSKIGAPKFESSKVREFELLFKKIIFIIDYKGEDWEFKEQAEFLLQRGIFFDEVENSTSSTQIVEPCSNQEDIDSLSLKEPQDEKLSIPLLCRKGDDTITEKLGEIRENLKRLFEKSEEKYLDVQQKFQSAQEKILKLAFIGDRISTIVPSSLESSNNDKETTTELTENSSKNIARDNIIIEKLVSSEEVPQKPIDVSPLQLDNQNVNDAKPLPPLPLPPPFQRGKKINNEISKHLIYELDIQDTIFEKTDSSEKLYVFDSLKLSRYFCINSSLSLSKKNPERIDFLNTNIIHEFNNLSTFTH